jgi:hypothetical protein
MAAGAIHQARAAEDAAEMQKEAALIGIAEEKRQYNQTREDYAPWRTTGANALKTLEAKISAGPGDYTTSPGYEARIAEGQKGIERSAAARGSVLSGSALKGLERFSQDYASNEYNNFLDQYYKSLNPLQSIAGVGLTATGGTAAAGSNATNMIAQLLQNYGEAAASGTVNRANAITGGIQSGLNNALSAYSLWRANNQPSTATTQPTGTSLNTYNTTGY